MAEYITDLQFRKHPDLEKRFGNAGKARCREDAVYHLTYLAEAIRINSPVIFTSYLQWAQLMLKSRNIPLDDLLNNLEYMKVACSKLLQVENLEIIQSFIDTGIGGLNKNIPSESFLIKRNPLFISAKLYLSLLLSAKRNDALHLILDLVNKDHSIGDIYEHIFEVTQHEVGLLWQKNEITVAHEHYCSAATQQIMSALYTYIFNTGKRNIKLIACSIGGDLHEIGIRMISDLFEMDGWDTYYVGANMPDANIISAIKEQKAIMLAISVSLPIHISKAEELIAKIRIDQAITGTRIIIGGYAFKDVPDLWKHLGADGYAPNGRAAVKLANGLILN